MHSYATTPYYHVGRASDLTGKDRVLYRFFEIVPGALAWGTLIGAALLSWLVPVAAAYVIIAFDLYWLLKTVYLSIHLRHNWKRIKENMSRDWGALIADKRYDHLFHLIILPYYKESYETIAFSLNALLACHYDKKKILVVLAAEERAGTEAQVLAEKARENFAEKFGGFVVTIHPKDIPGDMPGKGSNITYAAEEARTRLLDEKAIDYKDVIVSAFDIDTVAYPGYFQCLTWHFLEAKDPFKVSFQPVPVYNNNIWQAPSFSRVVAVSGTFWQMVQQERPEKLATFSSHAVSFKALYEAGYWQRNMVSEDSRIFWNLFLANDGDYSVVPIAFPVSMDANLAKGNIETLKNVYKQNRRWGWGAENIPYILMGFVKNKNIPLKKKIHLSFVQLEGFWSLATNPLIIFLLGWLPVLLGGAVFNNTVLAYNLPVITRNLMILAMCGLILSSVIGIQLLPPRPKGISRWTTVVMVIQWILVPITIMIFGAFPALEAQTRLMIGKYLGFWVTPKYISTK
jgi:cellulose synthase/poly-beta-1,6-N-acetylglucosamine synthase-like glycosyltransferase